MRKNLSIFGLSSQNKIVFRFFGVIVLSLNQNAFGLWRKLFKFRCTSMLFLKQKIGNGNDTFLWLDNWHLHGSRIAYDTSTSLEAKVT